MDTDTESDCSDEYQFAESNLNLLNEVLEHIAHTPLKWKHYAWGEQGGYDLSDSSSAENISSDGDKANNSSSNQWMEAGSKRSLSSDVHLSSSSLKRQCRPVDLCDFVDSKPGPAGAESFHSNPEKSIHCPSARNSSNDTQGEGIPLPSSSDLVTTEHAAPSAAAEYISTAPTGPLTMADVEALLQLPPDQLKEQLEVQLPRLQLEQNLITFAESELPASSVHLWLKTVLTPYLQRCSVPSIAFSTSLCALAQKWPHDFISHCIVPLLERENAGDADQLLKKIATEALPEQHLTSLIRQLCGRPLSMSAIPLILAILPSVAITTELASTLSRRLCQAGEDHPDSMATARTLLMLAKVAGSMLEPASVDRLVQVAEKGKTPLRRPLIAALNRLRNV